VASVQATRHAWRICDLGGPLQNLLLRALPWFGSDAERHSFVVLHFPWGDSARFERLFEAVLAQTRAASALFVYDPRDRALAQAVRRLRRGALGVLAGRQRMWVTATGPLAGPLLFTPVNAL
jgi:hypothetical protein